MTSAICEEFGCTPEEAERQDVALCKRIMALRRYRDAWSEVNVRKLPQDQLTKGPWLEKVIDVQVKRRRGQI